MTTMKRWLYRHARRFEEGEYTGEVPSQDPSLHHLGQLVGWGLLFVAGFEGVRYIAPAWVALIIGVPWALLSGLLVRFTAARLHGMTVPEYSDYLDKRSEKHRVSEDKETVERKASSALSAARDSEHVEFPFTKQDMRYKLTIEKVTDDDG